MRRLQLLAAVTAAALLSAAPAPRSSVAGPTEEAAVGDPDVLRAKLEATTDKDEWVRVALDLLAALEARGEAGGSEAKWLVGRLLDASPDDPELLWRRAEMRRRIPDDRGAIDDMERLLAAHPDHALATRSRRALPALYLKAGLPARAARADEDLLDRELAEPVAVLRRLARTYDILGQPSKVAATLARLTKIAPDVPRYDVELAWLRADGARRLGTRDEAAEALLEFANLFPNDPRRAEALLEAARAHAETGRSAIAAALAAEAAAVGDERTAVDARLLRGTLLEGAGERRDARREYAELLETAVDPQQAGMAVQRLIDIEVEQRGSEAALVMLAGLAQEGDRFTRPIARSHFARLLASTSPGLAQDPARAAYFLAMAERIAIEPTAIPAVLLAAAGVHERTGAGLAASRLYRRARAAAGDDARALDEAGLGIARTDPEGASAGPAAPPDVFVERLAALERRGERAKIVQLVEEAEALGSLGDEWGVRARVIAARAATTESDPRRAVRLLENVPAETAPHLVVLSDALALLRRWPEACDGYRKAAALLDRPADDPMKPWSIVRVAACDLREAAPEPAKVRLERLLASEPPEPARLAAVDLLLQISTTMKETPTDVAIPDDVPIEDIPAIEPQPGEEIMPTDISAPADAGPVPSPPPASAPTPRPVPPAEEPPRGEAASPAEEAAESAAPASPSAVTFRDPPLADDAPDEGDPEPAP